jgi:hypothetical protein
MPPDTKTDPIRLKLHEGDDIYEGRIERAVHAMERDEENGLEPDYTGGQICKIACKSVSSPIMSSRLSISFLFSSNAFSRQSSRSLSSVRCIPKNGRDNGRLRHTRVLPAASLRIFLSIFIDNCVTRC